MSEFCGVYVPKNINELNDLIGAMVLRSPTFIDKTGYFPAQNIDVTFRALNESLDLVRDELGEDLYRKFRAMSDQMRAHFEADPGDKTGDTQKGRELLFDIHEILTQRLRGG